MVKFEMSFCLTRLWWFRFAEVGTFSKMVVVQFSFERLISGLGEHALLLEDGQDTHGLLNQLDTGLQIHTEINEGPLDTFLLVLFLFLHEHVMVEELLETLVGVVDANLLKTVLLFKRSLDIKIQDSCY